MLSLKNAEMSTRQWDQLSCLRTSKICLTSRSLILGNSDWSDIPTQSSKFNGRTTRPCSELSTSKRESVHTAFTKSMEFLADIFVLRFCFWKDIQENLSFKNINSKLSNALHGNYNACWPEYPSRWWIETARRDEKTGTSKGKKNQVSGRKGSEKDGHLSSVWGERT